MHTPRTHVALPAALFVLALLWVLLPQPAHAQGWKEVYTVEDPPDFTAGEYREMENIGFGFAVGTSGLEVGPQFFFDYLLKSNTALHISYHYEKLEHATATLKGLTTTKKLATSSIRQFTSPTDGWFTGGGTGLGSIYQKYHPDGSLDSSMVIVPVFVEAGWMGWDNMFFIFNAFFGGSKAFLINDNTGRIPDSEHQSLARSHLYRAKLVAGGSIGFGWYDW